MTRLDMACPSCGHRRGCELRTGVIPGGTMCDDCFARRPRLSSSKPRVAPLQASTHSADEKPQSSILNPLATRVESEVEELLRIHAEGRIQPADVDLPPLPDDATDAMVQTAKFYALVAGLRLWAGEPREVPFAGPWVAAKVGLPQRTVARALTQLVEAGVLVRSGEMPRRQKNQRGTYLYEPGRVARHLRRVA